MATSRGLISEDLVLIDDRLKQLQEEYLPRIPTDKLIVVAAIAVLVAELRQLRSDLQGGGAG